MQLKGSHVLFQEPFLLSSNSPGPPPSHPVRSLAPLVSPSPKKEAYTQSPFQVNIKFRRPLRPLKIAVHCGNEAHKWRPPSLSPALSPEMPFLQRTLSCTPSIHCVDIFKERRCGGLVGPADFRLLCQGNWGTAEKGCSLQWWVKELAWKPSCKAQGSDREKISQARFLRFTGSTFLSPYTQYFPVTWVSPKTPLRSGHSTKPDKDHQTSICQWTVNHFRSFLSKKCDSKWWAMRHVWSARGKHSFLCFKYFCWVEAGQHGTQNGSSWRCGQFYFFLT